MYNMSPESVSFRDYADLNFPAYLDNIKEPIALDSIKERLDEKNLDQYSSVRSFLADLRKMFRNCFTFNSKESEIYKHAKKLEDKLDKLLQVTFFLCWQTIMVHSTEVEMGEIFLSNIFNNILIFPNQKL